MVMICPCCAEMLNRVDLAGRRAMMCPACDGLWFEKSDFAAFVKGLACSGDILPENLNLFKPRAVTPMHGVHEPAKYCPQCRKKMVKFNFAYDSNVILDKCPDCQGIWSDNGEVREVAEYLKRDPRVDTVAEGLMEAEMIANPPQPDPEPGAALARLGIVMPLSDDVRSRDFPIVTFVIAIAAIALYASGLLLTHQTLADGFKAYVKAHRTMCLLGALFTGVGLPAFILTIAILVVVGDNVESTLGRRLYLLLYLACAAIGLAAYALFGGQAWTSAVGLRSGVAGVAAAYVILFPAANLRVFAFVKVIEIPAAVFIGIWFIVQLLRPALVHYESVHHPIWAPVAAAFTIGAITAYAWKTAPARDPDQPTPSV